MNITTTSTESPDFERRVRDISKNIDKMIWEEILEKLKTLDN